MISWVFGQSEMGRSAQQPAQAGRMPLSLSGDECWLWGCSVGLHSVWDGSFQVVLPQLKFTVWFCTHPKIQSQYMGSCSACPRKSGYSLFLLDDFPPEPQCHLSVLFPASGRLQILTTLGAEPFPCLMLSARASFLQMLRSL